MHEYKLIIIGIEGNEYLCPECKRRIVIAHNNQYNKIVLNEGNRSIQHTTGWINMELQELED